MNRHQKARALRLILGTGGIVCAVGLAVPALSGASLKTRSCGSTRTGFPVSVRATPNVSCGQARHVMAVVYGETNSRQCYSHPGQFRQCTVQGFHCTMRSVPQTDISSSRCTKGRHKLVLGRT